jgi:hypothetical protein
VNPKYWLLKTLLATLLPSGTGVTKSLALDQAPLTRRTSDGSAFGCGLLEKSPPLCGELCAWAMSEMEKQTKVRERENLGCIFKPILSKRKKTGRDISVSHPEELL